MKLFERLPDGVKAGERFYRCDFDFRNVLKMLEIMQREDISPLARDYHCIRCQIIGEFSTTAKFKLNMLSGIFV